VHERLAAPGPADEIKNLSDTVDGLLERLDTALGAQRRVVANAAHELRTPLTLERALLEETLMDREAGLETYRATFDRLLELCRNQGKLLESLLTLAGSERGLEEREPVDLALAAEQVLLTMEPELARRGLRVIGSLAPADTTGHPALAERLVGNLVENAVEYNLPNGWIEVSTSTREGRAVVVVENSGPPVSPDRVAGLFEPFQRLDRSHGHEKHHGLGLSIVRAIAAGHDAVVEAAAGREGGLRIEIAFPAATAVAGQAPATAVASVS
jgi:signal transduction histidine kinase